ncbi:MAG TPA: M23 family metallopeptidase [Anaeromyxobacteraceae bacterium]|jgi:murein DD-endopeptidase MepM/ murein hydrolase activator NlpD|nr:M23 family metallopeptidase [Anaeromyxobacteraceae bacterium]
MVRLSIDPPSSFRTSMAPRSGGGGGWGRFVFFLLVIAGVGGGGYYFGRRNTGPAEAEAPRHRSFLSRLTGSREAPSPAEAAASPRQAAAPQQEAPPEKLPSPPALPGTSAAPALAGVRPQLAQQAPGAAQPQAPRRIQLTLQGSLEESIARALPEGDKAIASELTQVVNRLLVWYLQVARDGRRGDKIEVVYRMPDLSAPVPLGQLPSREPIVDALRYGAQKLGKVITAFRYKPDGAAFARYYQDDGQEVEERLVDSPIASYEQVTSLLRDGRRHKGVDFKTPVGTPVVAPFDGTVERRNWHFSANGNCLELVDAKSGRHAIFLHLEQVPKEMSQGRRIKKGEQIALSGNTGHSTAPHLHYQLEAGDGRVLDPFSIHATRRLALEGAAKDGFAKEKARLETMLSGATASAK